jgi:hypothetical protein
MAHKAVDFTLVPTVFGPSSGQISEGNYPVGKPIAECATGPRFSQIASALIATITATNIRI